MWNYLDHHSELQTQTQGHEGLAGCCIKLVSRVGDLTEIVAETCTECSTCSISSHGRGRSVSTDVSDGTV